MVRSSSVTLSVTLIWHHGPVNGHLIRIDGTTIDDLKPADVEEALHNDQILWLDLHDSSDESLALLRDVFRIHPLAVEDALEFGQRPKIEDYENFVSVVFFGASAVGQPMIEVHCFFAENFLVTMHREPCMAFEGTRTAMARHHSGLAARIIVLHHVLDSLSDSVFPMLASFDDKVDAIQEQIMIKPERDQLESLFTFKRWLTDVRKVVAPQRDMLNALLSQRVDVPGMTKESEPYFRDLYDNMIRINDLVDSHRDLLSNSMDAYWSMQSNKQNDVMKQLTIMATIFLPLTYLTGFFGQNFGWLVTSVGGWEAFFGIGVGTEAIAVIFLLWTFRRRGWL
jgi:magnesium transporter